MRWNIYAAAKQWELAAVLARKLSQVMPDLPIGWLELAHALHSLRRTQEARDVLLPIVDRFPGQYLMRYKLACYASQLGKLDEARRWLQTALSMTDSTELARTALQDPDLKPIWSECPGSGAQQ